jgi:hypothetical protein
MKLMIFVVFQTRRTRWITIRVVGCERYDREVQRLHAKPGRTVSRNRMVNMAVLSFVEVVATVCGCSLAVRDEGNESSRKLRAS